MAALVGLRTAISMLYYSAQRYDPQRRQQQPALLSPAPLNILKHLPPPFTAPKSIYIPSVFSRLSLSTRLGTATLLRDGSTAFSSNRGSSSRGSDEYSGRISALTNTAIFGSDETSLTSLAADDPTFVKEPDSGEQRTPSIESMLSAMQLGERVITPPPSSVIRQCDDIIEETDKSIKDEEIRGQVSSVSEDPGLALETSNPPSNSHILDQHPDYDSAYDCTDEEGTISDFFIGQDPDDPTNDIYSFGQSIGSLDTHASVSSNRVNIISSPTRPPSIASSSSSVVSSIRFRPIEPSAPRRRASILSHEYERQPRVTPRRSFSFIPNGPAIPSRRIAFVEPVAVPLPPTSRGRKTVAWWKPLSQRHRRSSRHFCSGITSRQSPPESILPDAPSQPISRVATSIATPDENAAAHSPLPPSLPQSPAHSTCQRPIHINLGRLVSAIVPCIPISRKKQEPHELGKEEPKEKSRSKGIFPVRWVRRLRKHKSGVPKAKGVVEEKSH
ncbi:hypothetical protein AGABI2DRAFT_118246 [Agaricus bisporus var. bisporus H97]|uniref:hypothetical protein n=1 Tax=Agaricus bisporus var. bisporus (strain H97 / ATCC MYA-4626 / FGSC 10389) TaxID=936046 RepID=UPI00029F558F|nr:hypothetical protein AGABI2DRAFT_118246 [Agaricus bisporus var. bisporus H97]EKV47698.1 hypothetical protein AGABI2DRAFT_118246 [Agaricus bisporus var. bisporus H97]